MSVYYCHNCAARKSLMSSASPVNLTGTPYQLEKFIKHTAPEVAYPVNSIFNVASEQVYSSYIVDTSASGCVQLDNQGRTNIIWIAGEEIGATFQNGIFVAPNNAVKVVLHDNIWKIHAFPTLSDPIETERCEICGNLIAY